MRGTFTIELLNQLINDSDHYSRTLQLNHNIYSKCTERVTGFPTRADNGWGNSQYTYPMIFSFIIVIISTIKMIYSSEN